MKCPRCKKSSTKVIDSRSGGKMYGIDSVRRRRKCKASKCSHRFTTYEILADGLDDIDKLLRNLSSVTEASAKVAQMMDNIGEAEK